MRILVCGSRNYTNRERVYNVLDDALELYRNDLIIIAGGARGADTFADDWTKKREVDFFRFPAKWTVYGNPAGPIRNRRQFKIGEPELGLAFHENIDASKGTKDMVTVLEDNGVEVTYYD